MKVCTVLTLQDSYAKLGSTQEEMTMDSVNADVVNVGDEVYWNFVFGRPDSSGVVIGIENDRYHIEDADRYYGEALRYWMNRDEFVSAYELENGEC